MAWAAIRPTVSSSLRIVLSGTWLEDWAADCARDKYSTPFT